MKINKLLIFLIFLLVVVNFRIYAENNIYIAYKVENEVITNIDIKNESKYLMALNKQLKNIDKNKILAIATESIIKEKIKEIELLRYYNLDQKNPYLKKVIKDFYFKLNLNSQSEFENYLKEYGLTIKEVIKKIEIETVWNQLILEKYKNQIKIDVNMLKKKVSKKKMSQKKISYFLSEIIFEKKRDQPLDETVKKINLSINEIGFENTANLYSLSDTAKFGGKIGWVEKENLLKKISKVIVKLKVGDHTKPIQIGNNFLIIKLGDVKESLMEINENNELKKLVAYEQNRQLNQFSKIYFNKVRLNTNISEL
jgi:peptidyl-prolyl cis-trans isomerase SurA